MKKKIFALALSMTMAFSAVSSYAEVWQVNAENESGTEVATVEKNQSFGTSSDIEGAGSVPGNDLDKDITIVTLPAYAPGFTLDPTGMYATGKAMKTINDATDKTKLPSDIAPLWDDTAGAFDQDEIADYTTSHAGQLTYDGEVMQVTNKGANPVAISATFLAKSKTGKTKFEASATDISTTKDPTIAFQAVYNDAVVRSPLGVESADTKKVCNPKLKVSPAVDTDGTTLTKNGEVKFGGEATDEGVDFKAGGTSIRLALPGDDSYGMAVDASGKPVYKSGVVAPTGADDGFLDTANPHNMAAQGFIIAGKCAPGADWSKYAGTDPEDTLSYRVVYKVDKITNVDTTNSKVTVEGATAAESYSATTGLIGSAKEVKLGLQDGTAALADAEITFAFEGGVDGVTAAQGTLLIKKSDNTTFNVVDQGSYWRDGSYGKIENNKITIKKAALTAAGLTAAGTFTVTVKGSDNKTYTATGTLTA